MRPRQILVSVVACAFLYGWPLASGRGDDLDPRLPGDVMTEVTAPASVMGRFGIAPTPRHFPRTSPQELDQMWPETTKLASVAVFIYQWSDPQLETVPALMTASARQSGLAPVLALSPTTLDQQRKELDIPRGLNPAKKSFEDPTVRREFVHAAERLARLEPEVLCLGTEINFLALQRLDEFLRFVLLYKETYHAVKKISPRTRVCVSFQYELVRIVDNKEANKISEHAKLIDVFRPELDVIVLTSYPSNYYDSPTQMPANYYEHFRAYLRPDDRVMVMEIGWPSAGRSTPEKQQQFVARLPGLLAPLKPELTAWSLLHDVKLDAFGTDLATTGLLTTEGDRKPAVQAWQDLFEASGQPSTSAPRSQSDANSR